MKRIIKNSVTSSKSTNPQSEYEYRKHIYLKRKHEFETLGEDDNNDVLSREEKMNIAKAEMDKVNPKSVKSAKDATFKNDKRLSTTSERYKGYLIVLDRGGDGYNVYDKHRELEDAGYPSKEAAKNFIDELVANDDVYSADAVDDIEREFQRIDRSGTDEEVAIAAIMYNLGTTMREAREILPTLSEDKIKDYVDYYYLRDLPTSERVKIWNKRKITSATNSEYALFKKTYSHSREFKDKDTQSGSIRDLIDELENKDISYEIYDNKTDNGCTVFYDDDGTVTAASYGGAFDIEDDQYSDWRELASKSVEDSDGFYTDYTLYTNGSTFICMFGDKDIYEPDEAYADYETENEEEAYSWFDNYEGFADEDDDDEFDIYASKDIEASMGRYDDYFGQTAAATYGELISDNLKGQTISKRKDLAEEPGGLIYEANTLGIDMWDLLEALEGMCREGRAREIDDSTYEILGSSDIYSSEDFDEYEDDIQEIDQEFTSENTSINSTKLPAVFRMVQFEPGTINIDYGGGRFDNVADYLTQFDVINLVYDPYNRSKEHNKEVIRTLRKAGGADTATCSNVLNVIKEPEVRKNVLENISKVVKPGGKIYITVYEGTGKGDEGATKSGYQLNRKTADYLEEIQEVYPDATRKGKLIVATNSGSVNSSTDITASSKLWMGKYKSIDGKTHKVYFAFNSSDFEEAEQEFEDIIKEPYTYCRLLGTAPSEKLLQEDGFEKIESSSSVEAKSYYEFSDLIKLYNDRKIKYLVPSNSNQFSTRYEIYDKNDHYMGLYEDVNDEQYKFFDDAFKVELYGEWYKLYPTYRKTYYDAINSTSVNSSTVNASDEGYVYTYCDECGKKNRVKVTFNNFNEPFNDTEYKCKYCGTNNLLTDPHSYDENGNVVEASQSYLDRIEELMNQGLDEETASREAYAEFYPDEYDVDDYDEIYSANYGGAYYVEVNSTRRGTAPYEKKFSDFNSAFSFAKKRGNSKTIIYIWDIPKEERSSNSVPNAVYDFDSGWQIIRPVDVNEDRSVNKTITSANYGGAYDIDPEQYFTREDLVEFADDVVDRLNVISYSKFDYTEVYLEPGNDLELTIAWSDYEDTIKEHIDMRKIRKPSDLCKVYAPLFVNRAKEVFSEYGADFGPHYEEDEIYSSKQSNSKLNQIKDKITKVVKNVMMSAEFGFPEDEVEEYSVVEVDPSGKVEVRAEVGYDGLMTLCDALNPIVQRYDKDSYFEPVQPGIIQAWIENKNDVVESSKSPNSVANKYPEYMKVSRGGQDFSVHYNLIDNSPSADAHKMWLEFQASVSAIKPYDDAEYAWAQIENGHINVIKGGKVIQQYYYFDADDMDVENSEWCDSIIEQAIDYISKINDKVESRMVHNSTSTKGETIEAGYYDVPERPLDPPEYDDPVEEDPIQEICEFSFDAVVILDKDGGWDYENNDYSFAANPDDKHGDWYTYEDHIYLTDQTGMVEDLDDLIEPMMPAGPGKYRIQGDATMVFDVDNLYAYYDYYRDGSYDRELLKDDAEVTFNYQESKVENFKFTELN